MKASTKRAFSLLATMALLIAAFVIYAALVRPAYSEILKLKGELSAKQDFFAKQEQAIKKVVNLIQQYQGAGRIQDVISLSLPESESLSAVFGQLNFIAKENNINIEVFGVQHLPVKASKKQFIKGLNILRLNLRLTGNYEAFKEFLRNVETNIRVMDVVSFKVEPAGSATQDIFVYNATVDTYYQSR